MQAFLYPHQQGVPFNSGFFEGLLTCGMLCVTCMNIWIHMYMHFLFYSCIWCKQLSEYPVLQYLPNHLLFSFFESLIFIVKMNALLYETVIHFTERCKGKADCSPQLGHMIISWNCLIHSCIVLWCQTYLMAALHYSSKHCFNELHHQVSLKLIKNFQVIWIFRSNTYYTYILYTCYLNPHMTKLHSFKESTHSPCTVVPL